VVLANSALEVNGVTSVICASATMQNVGPEGQGRSFDKLRTNGV
jgi:hypothetical protein